MSNPVSYRHLKVEPDFSHTPDPTHLTVFPLLAGTRFVKVYNRGEAETLTPSKRPTYDRQDFNPTVLDDDQVPVPRGRFSSSRSASSNPPYKDDLPYMYIATYCDTEDPDNVARHDESIAVWEILQYNDLLVGHFPTFITDLDLPTGHAFCYLENTRDLKILDISNARALQVFLAEYPGGVYGNDYVLSRRWGRYFRDKVPDVDGFAYTSTRLGPLHGHHAYVVYESGEHVTIDNEAKLGRVLVAHSPSIDFDSPKGREILRRSLGPGFVA